MYFNPFEWVLSLLIFYGSKYFFIILIAGGLIFVSERPRGDSEDGERSKARAIAVIIFIVGILGAIQGVPNWYQYFANQHASDEYFARTCQSKAIVELPKNPQPSRGIAWVDPMAAAESFLSGGDKEETYGDPRRGGYQMVEVQNKRTGLFEKIFWDSELSSPNRIAYIQRENNPPSPTTGQEYTVRTRSVTTSEDSKYGIDGIETIVTKVKTNEVIARRVIYSQYSTQYLGYGVKLGGMPDDVCPRNELENANCTWDGCSVMPFLRTAVPPLVPRDPSKAFQLYVGIGRAGIYCDSTIYIGPGIRPKDISVSVGETPQPPSLNFRVNGTKDQVYCIGDGGRFVSRLSFASSGAVYPLQTFLKDKKDTQSTAPVAPSAPEPAAPLTPHRKWFKKLAD